MTSVLPKKAMIAISVDQDRWWVVKHSKGYVFWDGGSTKGMVMFSATREAASRFSSARLAWHFLRSLFAESSASRRGAPRGQGAVVKVTRHRKVQSEGPPPRIFVQTGSAMAMMPAAAASQASHAGSRLPSEKLRAAIAELIRARGVRAACSTLFLSREAVLRIVGGMPVRAGTIAYAESRLADLAEDAERSGAAVIA